VCEHGSGKSYAVTCMARILRAGCGAGAPTFDGKMERSCSDRCGVSPGVVPAAREKVLYLKGSLLGLCDDGARTIGSTTSSEFAGTGGLSTRGEEIL